MTDTTNLAAPEVENTFDPSLDDLTPQEDTQNAEPQEEGEGTQPPEGEEGEPQEPEEEFEEVVRGEKAYRIPKALAGELLMQADYTKKTQALSEDRRAVETERTNLQQAAARQAEFAADIANLGALNARLAPFDQVQDWATYLRTGGPEAQAHYAEFQALKNERDTFAQGLGKKVQDRAAEEQRETAKQIEAGRIELAKHIKGYGPDTLSKLETFAAPFGYSSEEIRQAEADPRSIRLLHLAMVGQTLLQQQKKTSTIAQSAQTKPVSTLRGAGGRIQAKPDTDDFKAFERLAAEKLNGPK